MIGFTVTAERGIYGCDYICDRRVVACGFQLWTVQDCLVHSKDAEIYTLQKGFDSKRSDY